LARTFAREILSNPEFCISQNAKTITLKDKPKSRVSLMDLMLTSLRSNGPSEAVAWEYVPFIKHLLNNDAPKTTFKNKALLAAASSHRSDVDGRGRGVRAATKRKRRTSHPSVSPAFSQFSPSKGLDRTFKTRFDHDSFDFSD
jgi:hypothetical protein